MTMQITFLGTAANVPTKERNHPAVHMQFLSHNVLFDCGEGTQRQMTIAGLSNFKITAIFITHIHADHLLGLGGIIQTQAFLGKKDELLIFGPKEIKKYVDFYSKWENFGMPYPITFIEDKEGLIYENRDYTVTAFRVKHSCETYGYVFEEKTDINLDTAKLKHHGIFNNPVCRELKEKGEVVWEGKKIKLKDVVLPKRRGRKVVYVVDTQPDEKITEYAKNADVLICDGTFSEELKDKAHEYGHMTAKDAARIAKKAKVDRLILTHFSPRYENEKYLEKEAKEIFKNTWAAKDMMRFEV